MELLHAVTLVLRSLPVRPLLLPPVRTLIPVQATLAEVCSMMIIQPELEHQAMLVV
jgi:hypothetical protein